VERADIEEQGQAWAGLMVCGRRVGLWVFFRVLLCMFGLLPWLIGVVIAEVILQGSSDCLAGCIPHFVVQVIRQIDGYGWHQPDSVT
jgi:hypothetical protein